MQQRKNPSLEIAPGVEVGPDHPCFIIAEAGINHNGSLQKAKELITAAHAAGAQCVKFQKRDVDSLFTVAARNRPYTSGNAFAPTYGEHKKFLEFTEEQFVELKQFADHTGILFTASPWDVKSADLLERVGVPFYKVASADLCNWPLLSHILAKGKPVVMSTGMASMAEVSRVVTQAVRVNPRVVLLQCTSTYPTPPGDVNLSVIQTYAREFDGLVVGYSGHENGIALSLAAATLGASVIERHLTQDRSQKGGDHAASLEPGGLRKLVRDIRTVEEARGNGVKRVMPGEEAVLLKLGKSVCSTRKIEEGEVIEVGMLCCKSDVVAGVKPLDLDSLTGGVASRTIPADCAVQRSWFQSAQ